MTAPFCRACAEKLLGPAVMAHIRQLVDEAPPLSKEQKAKLRAIFQAAPRRGARPAPAECDHKTMSGR